MAGPDRYRRQTVLPEIGVKGQQALRQANAVIVGLGALGSVSSDLLVRAGVGRMHLVDRDGRKLQTNISRLQDDRRIWDLAYNGILHSVVGNSADTNQLARKSLKLPKET